MEAEKIRRARKRRERGRGSRRCLWPASQPAGRGGHAEGRKNKKPRGKRKGKQVKGRAEAQNS